MNRTRPPIIRVAKTAVLASALLCVSASMAFAQARTLEGVWGVIVTVRDCTTHAALGPPIRELLTYRQGGTMTQSTSSVLIAAAQRSDGHGEWTHAGGLAYTERTVAMFTLDTPVFRAGWGVVTQTIIMTDADHFTSTGIAQFYDLDRQLYRSGCSSRVGERFR